MRRCDIFTHLRQNKNGRNSFLVILAIMLLKSCNIMKLKAKGLKKTHHGESMTQTMIFFKVFVTSGAFTDTLYPRYQDAYIFSYAVNKQLYMCTWRVENLLSKTIRKHHKQQLFQEKV